MRWRSPISESAAIPPSQNSLEAARTAGINVDTLLASNERPAANPFAKLLGLAKDEDEEDDSPRVTRAPAPAAAAAAAARETPRPRRDRARRPDAPKRRPQKAAVKVADAASKVKFIRTADASPAPSYRLSDRRKRSADAKPESSPRAAIGKTLADAAAGNLRPTAAADATRLDWAFRQSA